MVGSYKFEFSIHPFTPHQNNSHQSQSEELTPPPEGVKLIN